MCRKFSAVQEHCPPEKLANRHSLSFFPFAHRLKWVSTRQSLLKQAEKLEGTSPDVPKIFGSAGALPSRKTIRYSPFAVVFPICPPTEVGVCETKPTKAG
jgi:hypothetical protein